MNYEETEEQFANRFISHEGFELTEVLKRIDIKREAFPINLQQVTSTFLESIRRTEKVCSIPYNLAWLSGVDVAHNEIAHRSTVLALDRLDPFQDDLDVEVPKLSRELTHEKLLGFLGSEEGREQLRTGATNFLRRNASLVQPQLLTAAQDLILQCTVSVWAAMETFVSDFVRNLINLEPNRALTLLSDDECKKRIGKTRWTLEQLLESGLDLSSKVGDLVLSENDLSDLVSIKVVLFALFDRPVGLVKALEDDAVYLLGKSRHLLVHRAGRVDLKFERETASRWKAGTLLSISADELRNYAKVAVTVVEETMNAYSPTDPAKPF